MSGEHQCAATSTVNKKCECEDDLRESDRLWTDFEHCAQQVSRLYRDPTWKSLQTAAASTTQLYKSSIDIHRRGFEKGFRAGRISLAKEVMSALTKGSALDLNSLFEMLYSNVRMASTEDGQRMPPPPAVSSDTVAAVHLFQQALSPAASPSSQRGPDLNAFLSSQVQRHRKRQRQRSPTSPSTLIKKVRRI